MPKSKKGLTDKEELFVQELIKGKTQRQAHIIAYPSSKKWDEKIIDSQACTIFNKPKVNKRYWELKDKMIERAENECLLKMEDVINELKKVAFSNVGDFVEIKNGIINLKDNEENDLTSVQTLQKGIKGTFTIKTHDKLNALKQLKDYLEKKPELEDDRIIIENDLEGEEE